MNAPTRSLHVPLATVIENLRCEIAHLGDLVIDIEATFFDWSSREAPEASPPSALHQLDLLAQLTQEISDFISRMPPLPDDLTIDVGQAAAGIRLAKLRDRLLLSPSSATSFGARSGSSDIEYF